MTESETPKTTRVLHVVTNVGEYETRPGHPTGLWLSELSHAFDVFERMHFEQVIISPKGGKSPLEPRSLKFPYLNDSARQWLNNPERMALLEHTLPPEDIDPKDFDVIFFTGGHGVMFDFPDCIALQDITRAIYENGGVVASVCHGYCGLLEVKLSNGKPLVQGKRLTGFSWAEELIAGTDSLVPYNVEKSMQKLGAVYYSACMPFMSFTKTDGRLVTGQNPASAKATAQEVVQVLMRLRRQANKRS